MPLLSLPPDILLGIFVILRPEDVLVVGQTCRVLHEYTLNDYLWHQIPVHLPLDIEPYVDPNQLPGPILQAIVTRALRVNHNWRRSNPRIKQMTRLGDLNNVVQMQFIGADWLVVLRRSPASLSVWRVADTHQPFRAAVIDLPGLYTLSFCGTLHTGGREALIALISDTRSGTQLTVFSVSLQSELDYNAGAGGLLPSPSVVCKIFRPESEGRFYEVHVCGRIVAVGIPQFVNHVLVPSAYRILILNSATGGQCLIDPKFDPTEQLAQLHFRLYTRLIVLAAVRNQSTVLVRVHDLPATVFNESTGNTSRSESPILVESLTTPKAQYESPTIPDVDYHLSANSMHNISHISSISFHSLYQMGDDCIVHFPLANGAFPLGDKPSFTCPFRTELGASAEIVCLGETGQRAVWLERRWASDEYTLMKAAFSPVGDEPAIVQPLFARNLALPFELHTCRSLAFEEATGRVCLALHTGELYILQF